MIRTKEEGEIIVVGLIGLTIWAGVSGLYTASVVLCLLTLIYNSYNEQTN
jgi:hypothetical protein